MFLQIPTVLCFLSLGELSGGRSSSISRPREVCWLVLDVEAIEAEVGGEEAEAAKEEF